jgi:hypothetical protein
MCRTQNQVVDHAIQEPFAKPPIAFFYAKSVGFCKLNTFYFLICHTNQSESDFSEQGANNILVFWLLRVDAYSKHLLSRYLYQHLTGCVILVGTSNLICATLT